MGGATDRIVLFVIYIRCWWDFGLRGELPMIDRPWISGNNHRCFDEDLDLDMFSSML